MRDYALVGDNIEQKESYKVEKKEREAPSSSHLTFQPFCFSKNEKLWITFYER